MVQEAKGEERQEEAVRLASWDLTPRQAWDIGLLLNGAFSPLEGFMGKSDYTSVCKEMRLRDGTLWPIPITLDVTPEFASSLSNGDRVALRHPEGMVLAILTVEDIWNPQLQEEAKLVYGTTDELHPGVFQLFHQTNPVYVGGCLEGMELPPHHTFQHFRHTPAELRGRFKKLGWSRIVAFQTRNPMHRAHVELTKKAGGAAESNLLIHPVVGRTSPGDVDYFARVRCYQAALKHYPEQTTMLSLLPLAMRMAGPREALWHALIRKNYGCTHFIVGRDHAGPGKDSQGNSFYLPYAAQELAKQYERELLIEIMPFEEMVYVEDLAQYLPLSEIPSEARVLSLSGTELRRRLREGLEIPDWFSYPEVIQELRRSYPPRARQGFTVFFTGLSGSGKSTVANILVAKLIEIGTRPATLLDGDIVRKHLSSELGFSKHDRDLNVKRIGYVASEITKNRGVAVCAPIGPYRVTRREVREMISQYGGFIEVYTATPLEVCESRDRKGLYAKARAGLIKNFTGIDDPYEVPENPDVVLDTSTLSAEEAANRVLRYLEKEGYITNS
ncbi:MAG: adenylyltransferase [Candidatus Fraserbacteria bacterium RBG_16_55_9]|uniref:Adenylyl-sulfate kinase n=1 Tax=Fraserbacteria sp. (strain RBG_16_55_9) TaxID=1817864 RepID=A0A1F5UPW9_FRAXR|nr:MAG: adenylyltransferase [Candidatus Fraserbacteria bacterium RBG_16_55_9]